MAFTQKIISVGLQLADGNFGSGGNQVIINAAGVSGKVAGGNLQVLLRISCVIESMIAGVSSGLAAVAIYGLPLSLMNQMTSIGISQWQFDKNSIQVQAGDSQTGMTTVFTGLIHTAFVDATAQPQVCFRIMAVPGGAFYSVQPVAAISLSGSQDVATLMGKIAQQMGLTLENNGVNVKLSNPYYGGSPWTQAVQIARHANIQFVIDRGTLAIMPAGQPRQTGGVPLVSKDTGMIGYPAFRQASIVVTTLFNPAIQPGGQIQVQSDLTPACGVWAIRKITYHLDCALPHGQWAQVIEANSSGQAPV